VEFQDGSVIAQMGTTDMRIPIQLALTYPKRLPNNVKPLDFVELGSLTFEKPNFKNFPCLSLALKAASIGGTMPCVLNVANEVAVQAFMDGKIKFTDIARVVEHSINNHSPKLNFTFEDIFSICQSEARKAELFITNLNGNKK